MFAGKRDWRAALAVGVLVGVTLAVYGRVCGHEFTWWDDPMTLHHNPRYNPPSGGKIAQTWREPVDGLYAPVTYSYWGALAYLAEAKETDPMGIHLDARVFHAGSLLLHLMSVLVVFAILRLLGEGTAGQRTVQRGQNGTSLSPLRGWGGRFLRSPMARAMGYFFPPLRGYVAADGLVEGIGGGGLEDGPQPGPFPDYRKRERNSVIVGALAGALLFGVHPVQVETVGWASGGKDLLCGLLSLCAIYQYILYSRACGRKGWGHYVSGGVVLVLAMLAKPSAMVVPAMVGVLDLLILKRGWRAAALGAGGWAVLVMPLAVVARVVQTVTTVAPVAVWQRPLVMADSIAFYMGKLLWPVGMGPDYGRRPGEVLGMWGGAWPYFVAMVVAGVGVWAWRGRGRRPWVLAGGLMFVLGFGPVLGLTPFMFQYASSVADHYVYLPMLGVAMVVGWGVGCVAERLRTSREDPHPGPLPEYRARGRRRIAFAICTAAVAALGVRSNLQLRHWRNDAALWAHTMEVSPRSFNAPTNLAADLGREGYLLGMRGMEAQEAGRADLAARLFKERDARYAAATRLLERAVAIKPDYITARHNAFLNYLRLGENQKAVEHLEAMLAANDRLPADARSNFTTYHDAAGNLWMKLGQYEKAAGHFEIVLSRVPDHREAREELEKARAKMAEARIE